MLFLVLMNVVLHPDVKPLGGCSGLVAALGVTAVTSKNASSASCLDLVDKRHHEDGFIFPYRAGFD